MSGIEMRSERETSTLVDNRPVKRARQSEPGILNKSVGIPVEQRKHLEKALATLFKMKEGDPFLHPVNPIEMNLPDYYNVIKEPRDLGTIDRRLRQKGVVVGPPYLSTDEIIRDVRLVFDNCRQYNGPTHPVTQMANVASAKFEEYVASLPGVRTASSEYSSGPVPGRSGSADVAKAAHQAVSLHALNRTGSRPSIGTNPSRKQSKHGSDVDMLAKPRPRPPARDKSKRDPLVKEQLKFCKDALYYLHLPEFYKWINPFLQPVDLRIWPNYSDYVQKPMDFGTIRDNVVHSRYMDAQTFHDDVKLVFRNCEAYNPEDSPLRQMSSELEKIFDLKWKELPTVTVTKPKEERRKPGPKPRTKSTRQEPKIKKPKAPRKARIEPTHLEDKQTMDLYYKLKSLDEKGAQMEAIIQIIRNNIPKFQTNEEYEDLKFEDTPPKVLVKIYAYLFPNAFGGQESESSLSELESESESSDTDETSSLSSIQSD